MMRAYEIKKENKSTFITTLIISLNNVNYTVSTSKPISIVGANAFSIS